ncbi:MAG: family 65 glycosyl hydrolase domain-containing protein [Saprospiraceae bacterium]|nr:family 65 glycosyl hydrolase domain-containing protein [Saprospiraceae bacterium]
MKDYLVADPWQVIEEDFNPHVQRISESVFSLGNGRFGQRGNFEETYSGDSLKGNYFAGIYYPDKTRVGWWKIGYPEYFAKVLNAVEWSRVDIRIGATTLDLHKQQPSSFRRVLDMRNGLLQRSFSVEIEGHAFDITCERFCSMDNKDLGVLRIILDSATYSGPIEINSFINWDVLNEDANWDEQFWIPRDAEAGDDYARAMAETKKTAFVVASAMTWEVAGAHQVSSRAEHRELYSTNVITLSMEAGKAVTFTKYAGHQSTLYQEESRLFDGALTVARNAREQGYATLREAHAQAWHAWWDDADITIDGDVKAQQGIRFNIFHLLQTYTGDDPRLNIGPKGFTGEKYGGSTYWDTEAYCVPFYLGSFEPAIARQLLVYRYRHLDKAIENAQKLGFTDGAALYPMVTMNGEECHNEWEITFEEIHRNGAIAYAIYDYIRYTGDDAYLLEGGLEVLIAIARFWAQRVNWSVPRSKYVILGVTGPNEYENNVDNNWYTNYLARWCMQYATEMIAHARTLDAAATEAVLEKTTFSPSETERWQEICDDLFLPEDPHNHIILQQANYLEKEQLTVDDIPEDQRPINQNWSWDRILRSCFIKQADVLQGLFMFEERFDRATVLRNFRFYEPRTVHESSLSPCVHSILAAHLGLEDKAYEMYLRTARLDLEDVNNDTDDGLHITSMAGTWMAIVKGFGGVSVIDHQLHLNPLLPQAWQGIGFHLRFRDNQLHCQITRDTVRINNTSGPEIALIVTGRPVTVRAGEHCVVPFVESSISSS